MKIYNNLGLSIANSTASTLSDHVISELDNVLGQKILGQPDRNNRLRFYYKAGKGGRLLKVLVDSALQQVGATALNMGKEYLKEKAQNLIMGRKVKAAKKVQLSGEEKRDPRQGANTMLSIKAGNYTILCRDMYGNECADGIMLKMPTKKPITYNQYATITEEGGDTISSDTQKTNFTANFLVWYDCTAMVNISSSKNLVITQVAGRDYSRKELVSNGDINFSVSGHILSRYADVYPEAEVRKFIELMSYKGILEVKNLQLGQFNIERIVIKDYSLTPVEGSKSHQQYSFNAVGIQPVSEVEVDSDTLYLDTYINNTTTPKENKWAAFLKTRATNFAYDSMDSVGSAAAELLSQTSVEKW